MVEEGNGDKSPCGDGETEKVDGGVEIGLQIDKEEGLHEAVERAAHKHHEEEDDNADIGEDDLDPLHGVGLLGQADVAIKKTDADESESKKDVADHEGSGVVGVPGHRGDFVHDQADQGRDERLGESLIDNLLPIRS